MVNLLTFLAAFCAAPFLGPLGQALAGAVPVWPAPVLSEVVGLLGFTDDGTFFDREHDA